MYKLKTVILYLKSILYQNNVHSTTKLSNLHTIQSELEHEQSLNKTRQSQYITIVLLLQGQPFYNEKVIL
jgi:hypothetical protein